MDFTINKSSISQNNLILELYKSVSEIEDGLIRNRSEVNLEYIDSFLSKSISNGLSLVAQKGDKILGEIHAYTPSLFAFQHILTDLTIAVNPKYQGKGIGRKLFTFFLEAVQKDMPHIHRIELYTREHNQRNVKFYKSLGFFNEGRQENKIFKDNGEFETPIHMAWLRPTV